MEAMLKKYLLLKERYTMHEVGYIAMLDMTREQALLKYPKLTASETDWLWNTDELLMKWAHDEVADLVMAKLEKGL